MTYSTALATGPPITVIWGHLPGNEYEDTRSHSWSHIHLPQSPKFPVESLDRALRAFDGLARPWINSYLTSVSILVKNWIYL
jgi:hypothetical protein